MPAMVASGNEENEHCNVEPIMVSEGIPSSEFPKTVPLLCYTPAARQSLFFEMDRDGWVSISMLLSCLFFFGYKVEVNVMARHMQLHASIGTGFREQSEWGQSFTMVLGRRWE
jgi:hypothetical protein